MPCTVQELQRRLLNLEKVNRSQAVKIWQLEEEKMDLVRKVERFVRKDDGMREEERVSNKRRTVHFGGVHFSDDTVGREKIVNNDVNAVEEIETVLMAALPLQEMEKTGYASAVQIGSEASCSGKIQVERLSRNAQAIDAGVLPSRQMERERELIVAEDEVAERGWRLVEKPLPLASVGEVSTVLGENDLEKSDKLRRFMRGRPKTNGKSVASKAFKKKLQVEEVSAPRKRRLASQGKLKVGDRLKVAWGGKLYSCKVVLARQSALKVHYVGWGVEFEEWVPFPSNKVKMDK